MIAIRRVFQKRDAGPVESGAARLQQPDLDEALADRRAAPDAAVAAQAALF